MGLKSKLSKMKSFLFDEEDDEKEYKKMQKSFIKPDKKVLEKNNDFSKTSEIEELSFDEEDDAVFDEPKNIKSRTQKIENDFKFPEFDDDDFMVTKSMPEEIKPIVKEEPKIILYQGSKRKEEVKRFKPSPIISPIYGLLDKDGNTIQKENKNSEYKSNNDEITFDDVRKKAYGSFDDELENTIKRLSKKTIEEAEKEMEKEDFLNSTNEISIEQKSVVTIENEDNNDDMILPNINFKEIDVDKERNKNAEEKNPKKETVSLEKKIESVDDDEDDDTKEQDLFNLIDSMYQKGDEE